MYADFVIGCWSPFAGRMGCKGCTVALCHRHAEISDAL